MATVLSNPGIGASTEVQPLGTSPEDARWINTTLIILVCGIVGALMIGARLYQQMYAWSAGLDATSPEFQTYWMNLLFAQFAVEAIAAFSLWGYVWFSRPRDVGRVQTHEELRRFGVFIALIFCYVFAVFWAASFFGEEDASWHQTVVRDTSFTPSHIILFYWAFPIYIILGITAYLYARTRLQRFAARHSLPWVIGVAGPFMLLPWSLTTNGLTASGFSRSVSPHQCIGGL